MRGGQPRHLHLPSQHKQRGDQQAHDCREQLGVAEEAEAQQQRRDTLFKGKRHLNANKPFHPEVPSWAKHLAKVESSLLEAETPRCASVSALGSSSLLQKKISSKIQVSPGPPGTRRDRGCTRLVLTPLDALPLLQPFAIYSHPRPTCRQADSRAQDCSKHMQISSSNENLPPAEMQTEEASLRLRSTRLSRMLSANSPSRGLPCKG